MDRRIKKLMVKEGLVLLGFLLIGFAIFFLGRAGLWYKYSLPKVNTGNPTWDAGLPICEDRGIKHLVVLLLLAGYPCYLLITFIIWAIKVLRQK